MKKYKSYKGNVDKIAPNILDLNFKADAPNEKWVTDISDMLHKALERLPEHHQLPMHSGWHYQMNNYRLALESRRVVQSILTPVLSHHRTYGFIYGGSIKMNKAKLHNELADFSALGFPSRNCRGSSSGFLPFLP